MCRRENNYEHTLLFCHHYYIFTQTQAQRPSCQAENVVEIIITSLNAMMLCGTCVRERYRGGEEGTEEAGC